MTDDADKIILQVFAEWRHSFDARLDEMGKAIAQTVAGLGELKATQRVHGLTLDRVLAQTTKTNGRVDALEEAVDLIERREIREDGIEDGRAEQREAYRSAVTRAWRLVWSPAGRVVRGVALLMTGWTLREVWPW